MHCALIFFFYFIALKKKKHPHQSHTTDFPALSRVLTRCLEKLSQAIYHLVGMPWGPKPSWLSCQQKSRQWPPCAGRTARRRPLPQWPPSPSHTGCGRALEDLSGVLTLPCDLCFRVLCSSGEFYVRDQVPLLPGRAPWLSCPETLRFCPSQVPLL